MRSLVVEGLRTRSPGSPYSESDPYGFKLFLPDRYQSLDNAYRHTLDGDRFWMNERAGDILIDDGTRTIAERNTRWTHIERCLLFLMSVPENAPVRMRCLGTIPDDAEGHEWVEAAVSGFRSRLQLGFARADGMPAAVRMTGSAGLTEMSLTGYQPVDGILFPFTIEDRIGEHVAVTTISRIQVNTGVDVGDFLKR